MSYDFLIEMGWKSALISGAALALMLLLRSRSAADRAAVLRVGVVFLLALPVVAIAFPSLIVETAAPQAAPVAAAAPSVLSHAELASPETMASMSTAASSGDWNDPGLLFLLLYLGGVVMVGGRLLAGLWTLRRWTEAAEDVTDPAWLDALRRAAPKGGVRLLVSDDIESPLSWGLARPVILIDRDTLERPEDADAILGHEAAHVARRDWAALMASRIAVALFWFNPLVWLLDREVAQQAEEAADSRAVERVEPTRYAQTLLDWARAASAIAVPANAIAAPQPGIARRVRAIVEGRIGRRSGSFWTFAAIGLCAAIAAPVAALEFVPEAPEAPEPPAAPSAPAPAAAPAAPAAAAAPAAPAPAATPRAPRAPLAFAAMQPPVPPRAAVAPRPPLIDGERLSADIRAAVAEAVRTAEMSAEQARHASVEAHRAARAGMAAGAQGMMRGADDMERGARQMDEEARKLRNRDYRERQIAKAAARGEEITHEELLEAAEGMKEGAEGMREGAREMREAAEEMRRGG